MEITEVRVKLNPKKDDHLRGFCTLTFENAFVVRDIKIIGGPQGVFVAMPSRKVMDHCPKCKNKNHLRARYCNHCGTKVHPNMYDEEGVKLFCDVAHPINAACRASVENAILQAFHDEEVLAKQPGYMPRFGDFDEAGD